MKSLQEKIQDKIPSLVVFQHACNQDAVEVKYLMEELRAKYGDRANIIRVDASFNGNVKVHFKLKEYPTYILYKEGEELMRESGKKTLAQLEDMIVRAL